MPPLSDVFEGISVSHIVDNDYPMCASVIAARQSPKPFLACRVPNLKFDYLFVQHNRLNFKIDAYCVEKVLIE